MNPCLTSSTYFKNIEAFILLSKGPENFKILTNIGIIDSKKLVSHASSYSAQRTLKISFA